MTSWRAAASRQSSPGQGSSGLRMIIAQSIWSPKRSRQEIRSSVKPLARALAIGVHRLLTWGMLETPLTIVPAPTRRFAARRRGGDPVSRLATEAVAGHPDVIVVPALRMKALARDSVGLGTSARERNIAGRVLLRGQRAKLLGTEVVIVDDIVTTGATACESVRVLRSAGVRVAAVLAIAVA